MLFKNISHLELWRPFRSVEQNHSCYFGRRHLEEKLFEIITLDQLFIRRYRLKIFHIWSSGGPLIQRSVTICTILVKGIKRNISVKLFLIWTIGSGGNDIKGRFFYLEFWQPTCLVEQYHLCNFGRRHL